MGCFFARARSIKYQNGYASGNSNANNKYITNGIEREKKSRAKKNRELEQKAYVVYSKLNTE